MGYYCLTKAWGHIQHYIYSGCNELFPIINLSRHHFPANLCKSQFPGAQVKIFKLLIWLNQEYKELNKPPK